MFDPPTAVVAPQHVVIIEDSASPSGQAFVEGAREPSILPATGVDVSSDQIRELSQTSQLGGGNAEYVDHLYESWLVDPKSVGEPWRLYFEEVRNGDTHTEIPHGPIIARVAEAQKRNGHAFADVLPFDDAHARKQAGVLRLLTAYRSRGHLAANLDPLGMVEKLSAPDLELDFHGLGDADLDTVFDTGTYAAGERLQLRELVSRLQATYAATIGAEFMHISNAVERRWIYTRLEQAGGDAGLSADGKRHALANLTAAEGLERFLHTKYVGQKRFSLEGGESLIVLLDDIIRRGGDAGVRELVLGMAHRGRLNVLVNILGKPPHKLFEEFEGKLELSDDPAHSGDVKYHMGFSADVLTAGGSVHLALAFNPSHLEIVDPVVLGSVRARQTRHHDGSHERVLPVLMHGDASFSGQGVVMELLNMSQARGFDVGGTIHIVINNQIGFTTSDRHDARSTLYCTDVAKMINAPVLHVNGDDPEAVLQCTELAFEFRREFKKDVVIDLVCYRRHGHNEADEPAATQPLMYQTIRALPTTRELYAKRLEETSVIEAGQSKSMSETYRKRLESGEPIADLDSAAKDISIDWSRYLAGTLEQTVDTGVPRKVMSKLLDKILPTPDGFTLHPRVAKIYQSRHEMAAGKVPLDWGFAENLAYATIIHDGYGLRLTGQDSSRGTFFHRHAELHDQDSKQIAVPLASIREDVPVNIIDSLLSEEAVMGYEYGYATADPEVLVIWEAQFGDFANGAQVVIDQFISSGEAKWRRLCGMVLLLPHGYEGQGPEHSSARLERFLQLCALHNMQVCVPTTPSQMFHMLRRQMLRDCRKPLVVMTPKSLLRHKRAVSSLEDLESGHFHRVTPDQQIKKPSKVSRVVLCSGKVYYDLSDAVENDAIDNVAVIRVEQLYPFPRAEVSAELAKYKQAKEVVWCQEEPMNQGAWFQIRHHLQASIGEKHVLGYAGRTGSPAPATGHHSTHVAEQLALVKQALQEPVDSDHSSE